MLHQLTDSVKLLQKCAIYSGDKVLLLKRSSDAQSRPSLWDLPGGNAEWPTDASADLRNPHLQDLIREISEETGFECGEQDFDQPSYVETYLASDKQVYTVLLGWSVQLADKTQPVPTLSAEHTEYAWIKAQQLSDYDCGFAGAPEGFITKIIASSR